MKVYTEHSCSVYANINYLSHSKQNASVQVKVFKLNKILHLVVVKFNIYLSTNVLFALGHEKCFVSISNQNIFRQTIVECIFHGELGFMNTAFLPL